MLKPLLHSIAGFVGLGGWSDVTGHEKFDGSVSSASGRVVRNVRTDRSDRIDKTDRPVRTVHRRRANDRWRPLSRAEAKGVYERPDAFTDLLPWTEYDPDTESFLLDDDLSVAGLFELTPVSCEAKPETFMSALIGQIEDVIAEAIPEEDDSPWIFQTFVQNERSFAGVARGIRAYAAGRAGDNAYSRRYLEILDHHLARITQPGGLFYDDAVTGIPWRGQIRRVRATLYRRLYRGIGYREIDGASGPDALNEACLKLAAALGEIGVKVKRCGGHDLYDWLLPWFNPAPEAIDGDAQALLDLAPYPGDDAVPFGRDFAELLTFCSPYSELPTNTWWFDGKPHRVINIQGLRNVPKIGHFTGERRAGEHVFSLLDRFPEHTVLGMTVTLASQTAILNHVACIRNASGTGGAEASLTRKDAIAAEEAMAEGQKIFPVTLSVYLRGEDMADLRKKTNRAHALLVNNGLQPIYQGADSVGLDSYMRQLPMAYRADYDRLRRRSRLMFANHIARLSPLYGRARGTGNPGALFYNRGGEPLTFDPLNPDDRTKSGHLALLGPTGSGKSALLLYLLMSMMAIHRPRIVLIEAGNSFGLMAEFFARHGLSVNHVRITPSSDVSLPPFADATQLIEEGLRPDHITPDSIADAEQNANDPNTQDASDSEEDRRDLLGEMEIAARIMITGGDAREDALLRRPDRLVIRKAILLAARNVKAAGRAQVVTQDVVNSMNELAHDPALSEVRRQRARDMADSMELFCTDMPGRFFNREGDAWPDADVTILDMGLFAREGYEEYLNVAFIGLMNRINDRIERNQYDGRPTIVPIDEAHLITKNPMLAPYVAKITIMWRKLKAWLWLATPSLRHFPDASQEMLNMAEWWLCLAMPQEEIEQLARFRKLSDEHRALLLSAKKQPGKYTEGVVLSDRVNALFRSVVPALCLALAGTEGEEKNRRARIMTERNCTELEAAMVVAREIEATGNSVEERRDGPPAGANAASQADQANQANPAGSADGLYGAQPQ